jgi:hypothetical protein
MWESVRKLVLDVARGVQRARVGGMKGVRIVPVRHSNLVHDEVPPADSGATPHMVLRVELYVTNSSPRPLRIVDMKDPKGAYAAAVKPRTPGGLPVTEYLLKGVIAPDATEVVECSFAIVLPRNKDGSVTVQPFDYSGRLRLIDQYARSHRTRKLSWRR